MYDDRPEDYFEEENLREQCLDKALRLAESQSTKEDPTDMSDNDVVEAAKKFEEFINGDR